MDENDRENSAESPSDSLATSRSRRNRPDKHGRLAALQKLRELKGSKNKYEIGNVAPVYEEVDEREYSRRRRDKMEDDWIVDDDGSGYVEDGREIFDDEEDDDDNEIFTSKKSGAKGARGTKRRGEEKQGKGNIKNMLINMPVKKRKTESSVALDEDELLGDILQDLGQQQSPAAARTPLLAKRIRSSPSKAFASPINPFATKHIGSPATPKHSSLAASPVKHANGIKGKIRERGNAVSNGHGYPQHHTSPIKEKESLNSPPAYAVKNVTISSPGGNKKGTPLMTTPVRSLSRAAPRAVLRENVAVNSPPKAKRSLAVSSADAKVETEEDFADMDFSALDDDMMDDIVPAKAEFTDASLFDEDMKDETETKATSDRTAAEGTMPAHRGYASNTRSSNSSGHDASGWENLKSGGGGDAGVHEQVVIPELSFDNSKLPLVEVEDGKQVLRMFWLDAYEEPFRQAGTVFLFGKIWVEAAKGHASCCLTVRNIPRRVFLLPRTKRINVRTKEVISETVTMKDVYDEFNERISKRFGIKEFKSRSVTKSYAFEKLEVPNNSEYFEVRYSAEHDAMPADLCGETFSHVFGHSSSSLETFLLEKKLRGPCWLDVAVPQIPNPQLSWCKVEAVALNPNQVKASANGGPPPAVVTLTLTLCTTLNPSSHQSEVAAVGCLVHHAFPLDKPPPQPPFTQHFCALTKPADVVWPYDFKTQAPRYKHTKLEKMDTERALLGFLLAKVQQLDPDVIVGHDILGYDLGILLHRLAANKIPHWSRLSRLRRTQMPKLTGRGGYAERAAVCGRLVCDVKLSAKELIRAKSYDLAPLAAQVLRLPPDQQEKDTLDPQTIRKMYEGSDTLLQLVSLTMQNSFHVVRLLCELSVLPLALQITNIAGNVMSRTLLGGRSERNEYLLLHAFTERNYIPPDKEYSKVKAVVKEAEDGEAVVAAPGRKKAAYAGGLVLEPKKGFYDKFILLMDFNSLYPSIIQEYNICFTTINRQKETQGGEGMEESTLMDLPEPDQQPGVLPTEIRKLVESRKAVKNLMKASDLSIDAKMQYDIRQKALKLTANSMYGCLGFSHSRFYAAHLAAMVTSKGREILLNTRDLVQKLNFDVIYGDTDSIMINTNCTDYDQVFKLGHKIKAEVNKLYKQLELDVDGVYKYMLLLKKKKYAALAVTRLPGGRVVTEPELKGLDIVRRDWSQLAAKAGKFVLDQILSEQTQDERVANIHTHLEELATHLKGGNTELAELVITKQLTKRPEDYPDKAALAHVQVALRLNAGNGKKLRQGDTVPYVICQDGSNNSSSQRAYHPDELKKNTSLSIDTEYYLAHQLHPVVARLCDPIEGSDAARIAECLGLDPGNYRSSRQYQQGDGDGEDDDPAGSELPPEERFRGCDRFCFTCPAPGCDTRVTMDGPFRQGVGLQVEVCLQSCPNPKCQQPMYTNTVPLCNALTKQIREHVRQYYNAWLVCEDPGCSNRTRRVPLQFVRGFPICNLCRKGVLIREYTESQLYKQLCFYDYMFDFQKACQSSKDDRIRDDSLRRAYSSLRAEVLRFLDMSAYSQVDIGSLFSNLLLKTARG